MFRLFSSHSLTVIVSLTGSHSFLDNLIIIVMNYKNTENISSC